MQMGFHGFDLLDSHDQKHHTNKVRQAAYCKDVSGKVLYHDWNYSADKANKQSKAVLVPRVGSGIKLLKAGLTELTGVDVAFKW